MELPVALSFLVLHSMPFFFSDLYILFYAYDASPAYVCAPCVFTRLEDGASPLELGLEMAVSCRAGTAQAASALYHRAISSPVLSCTHIVWSLETPCRQTYAAITEYLLYARSCPPPTG